jgi:hypothetical protein
VSDVVFDWLPPDSPLPYSTVAMNLLRVMAQAGALERVLVPGKFLGAFPVKTEHFLLTDAASDLLTRQAAGADCRLLNACRESRPRLLDLLIREIKDGFHRREND